MWNPLFHLLLTYIQCTVDSHSVEFFYFFIHVFFYLIILYWIEKYNINYN
jgi:hypothetical protein